MKKHNYNVKNLLQILIVSFLLHSNVLVSCSLSYSVGFGSYCFSICYWLPGAYLINCHSQHYKKTHYVTGKQCLDFIEGFDELSMTVSLCLKKR